MISCLDNKNHKVHKLNRSDHYSRSL